jgi:hypothetical protein
MKMFKIHSLPLLLEWLIDLVVVYEFVHELVNPSTCFNLDCQQVTSITLAR